MARNDDTPRNHSARPDRPRPRPNSGMQPRRRAPAPAPPEHEGERIAKVIARAGLTSRRDAEDWIVAGRVSVNGKVIDSPALNIGPGDRVTVDGAPLPQRERTRLFLYHKPRGLVTSNADPEGRETIFDRLPTNLPRLLTVGRLDIGTEGLLLLTNDGGLARVLELPETGWLRRYRVRALGRVTQADLDALRGGITVEGIHYGPIDATLDREQGSNVWLTFAIREGKNREVRNVLGYLGLQVNRLIRVSYGPFQINELGEGEVEEIRTRVLREQLGERVIEDANCDFTAPVVQRPDATLAPPPSRDDRRAARRRQDDERQTDERPRDDDGEQRSHRDFRGDAFADAPKGRPRRGNAWREEDAPLRRHYRGEQKAERQPDLAAPQTRTGVLKDRKGRSVVVERIGNPKPAPVKKGPPKGGHGKRPFGRDDRPGKPHGERFDKPRGPRSDRPQGDRPFKRDDRPGKPQGERFDKPRGPRSDRPQGERPFRRDDRPGKPHGERFDKPRGPRSDRPQGERPFRRDDRPGKPHGERFDKPRGPRSDRPQGDRPFKRDDRPGKPRGERFDKPHGERSGKPAGPRPFKGRPRKPDRGSGPRPSRPR